MAIAERLALGTVQFGQPYGVANSGGRVTLSETTRILDLAQTAGIDTLDTAIGYGDSETRLGEIGVPDWRIVSKLPQLPEPIDDVAGWVESSVAGSLRRLGVDRLHGLLLHRSDELRGEHGDDLRAALLAVRESGMAQRVGMSVYGPDELDAVWDDRFDLVQTPFNVFDRRLVASGWLDRFVASGTEVHTRSAFLQGLLLMEEWPGYFDRFGGQHEAWAAFCAADDASPLEASLGFALAQPGIHRVVVGVDSAEHLEEILTIGDIAVAPAPDTLASEELDLIDPSRWELA